MLLTTSEHGILVSGGISVTSTSHRD